MSATPKSLRGSRRAALKTKGGKAGGRRAVTGAPEASSTAQRNREALRQKLTELLAGLNERITDPDADFSVESVAEALGVSKQTLHNHGLVQPIKDLKAERKKALGRVQRARPGARQAIARLTLERDVWKSRYETLLDQQTRLVAALRLEPSVDVLLLLSLPLERIDRTTPKGGGPRMLRILD